MNDMSTIARSLPHDPFLEQFFSRLPQGLHTHFTDRQLAALKSVFGDATRSGHGFDIRLGLPTPWAGRGIYMVLLGGRDRRGNRAGRRSPSRRGRRGLAVLGKLIVGALFIIQILFVSLTLAVWLS